MNQTWTDPDVVSGAVTVQPPRLTPVPLGRPSRERLRHIGSYATSPPGKAGLALVGSVLARTLLRLLGPNAPLDLLFESAFMEAFRSWPPRDATPLPLWAQCIAASKALDALKSRTLVSDLEHRPARPGSVRESLSHLQSWMRSARPEEQLAFALLELNASSLDEAAAISCVPPWLVRQRAWRVRRRLLFAARSDLVLRRYLLIAMRLRSLLRCWDRATLQAPPSQRAQRVSTELELELEWFA